MALSPTSKIENNDSEVFSYEKKVKKANGLKDADEIYEGQCLVLPKYKK